MKDVLKLLAVALAAFLIAAWASGTTGYQVNGYDLSTYFAPYSSGSKASATGYKSGGTDLNQIFAPYTGGSKTAATNYLASSVDLNAIFAPNGSSSSTTTSTITSTSTTSTIGSTSTSTSTTSTIGAFSASLSTDSIYDSGSPPLYSDADTCTASGGVAPYTYHWYYISGSVRITCSNATNDITNWYLTGIHNDTAYWYCQVTDSLGSTANSESVQIHLDTTGA
jgi:hypothetical protein